LLVALFLPIALAVTFGVAHLLEAMADMVWASILYRAGLIGGIVWIIDLICLLIALAVVALDSGNSTSDE
jgi:hypothetical protein